MSGESSTKAFGPIRDDYAFFQRQSGEIAADLRAYAAELPSLTTYPGVIRMLDFGCGDGAFSAEFLRQAAFRPERLQLSLMEPDAGYRQQAADRLRAFTSQQIQAWPSLPSDLEDCFELVLANHVLYYVADLDSQLAAIRRSLAKSGLFVTAMAGPRNRLIQFWNHWFALIGKPVPYHNSENLEAGLNVLGIAYTKHDVRYELAFPDSEENCLKIARFLMGAYFAAVPRQAILDSFEPFRNAGQIAMDVVHEHFLFRQNPEPAVVN